MQNVTSTKKKQNSSDYDQQPTDDEDNVSEQPLPQEPPPVGNMRPSRARKLPARIDVEVEAWYTGTTVVSFPCTKRFEFS